MAIDALLQGDRPHGGAVGPLLPPMRIPRSVAYAVSSARTAFGLAPGELARLSTVPLSGLHALEIGYSPHSDPLAALGHLERVAVALGLDPEPLVEATLTAWSAAYALPADGDSASDAPQVDAPQVDAYQVDAYQVDAPQVDAPQVDAPQVDAYQVDAYQVDAYQVDAPQVDAFTEEDGPDRRRPLLRLERRLRGLAWGVAAVDLMAAALLGAAHLGLLAPAVVRPAVARTAVTRTATAPTVTPPGAAGHGAAPAVELTSSGGSSAAYEVLSRTFQVTVTAQRPAWVEVVPAGGSPTFAQVVAPGTTYSFTEQAPVSLQVGAGGTSVTVRSGSHSLTVQPPAAPFTYRFSPA